MLGLGNAHTAAATWFGAGIKNLQQSAERLRYSGLVRRLAEPILSLSTENAPRAGKNIFVDEAISEYAYP